MLFQLRGVELPDGPSRGVYQQHEVYDRVHGMDSVEPWLARIEQLDPNSVEEKASSIPIGWYRGDRKCLKLLTQRLVRRKSELRRLIEDIRRSGLHPFRYCQTSNETAQSEVLWKRPHSGARRSENASHTCCSMSQTY